MFQKIKFKSFVVFKAEKCKLLAQLITTEVTNPKLKVEQALQLIV